MRPLFFVILLSACLPAPLAAAPRLGVVAAPSVAYRCADGSRVQAVYYRLSDDSLAFVKLVIGKREYTLPNLVSASGSRYSDLVTLEWWIKGDAATLNRAPAADNPAFVECQVSSPR